MVVVYIEVLVANRICRVGPWLLPLRNCLRLDENGALGMRDTFLLKLWFQQERLTAMLRCYILQATLITVGLHLFVFFGDDFAGSAWVTSAPTAHGRHAALVRQVIEQVAIKTLHRFSSCTDRFSRNYYMT